MIDFALQPNIYHAGNHSGLRHMLEEIRNLLYDETPGEITIDQSEESTMILKLGHADTVRINAMPGTTESRGSQYFWLSKDCFDFFPALTIRNTRGYKGTLSIIVSLKYADINQTHQERVTFEAENNLDFRLGTGLLRNTHLASEGDLACISRVAEAKYELHIIRRQSANYDKLVPFAISFIGHQGKQYGYIENQQFENMTDIVLGR